VRGVVDGDGQRPSFLYECARREQVFAVAGPGEGAAESPNFHARSLTRLAFLAGEREGWKTVGRRRGTECARHG